MAIRIQEAEVAFVTTGVDGVEKGFDRVESAANKSKASLADMSEVMDKRLEGSIGRTFKVTDRFNGILGQVTTAAGLVTLGIKGVSLAVDALRKHLVSVAPRTNVFVKAMEDIRKRADKASASIDAVTRASAGLAGGTLGLTAREQLKLAELADEEAKRIKTATQLRQDQTNLITKQNKLLKDGANTVALLYRKGRGSATQGQLEVELDYELARVDAIKAQRVEILKRAKAREVARNTDTEATKATGDAVAAVEVKAQSLRSVLADLAEHIALNSNTQALTGVAVEIGNAWADMGAQIEASNRLVEESTARAAKAAADALERQRKAQEETNRITFDSVKALTAQGISYAATAFEAAVYGESIGKIINESAQRYFFSGLMGAAENTALALSAGIFNPAAAAGYWAAAATFGGLAGLAGGIAAATGGFSRPSSGGAAASPREDLSRRDLARPRDEGAGTVNMVVQLQAGRRWASRAELRRAREELADIGRGGWSLAA